MSAPQPSLFDAQRDPRPVRSTDPVTSAAALATVDEAARKAEVLRAMFYIGLCNSSARAVASEIHAVAQRMGSRMDVGSVRSRLAQLANEDPPRVRITTGVRTIAKPEGSGRPQQVWDLTREGLAWCEADRERGAA